MKKFSLKLSAYPYIDLPGCKLKAKIEEGMFHAILEEQRKAGK